MNFEDPTVFRAMTDLKKGIKIWRKTYGFDFGSFVEGNSKGDANLTSCSLHCLEAEYAKFAQSCKRKGGIFKCCVLGWVGNTRHTFQSFSTIVTSHYCIIDEDLAKG